MKDGGPIISLSSGELTVQMLPCFESSGTSLALFRALVKNASDAINQKDVGSQTKGKTWQQMTFFLKRKAGGERETKHKDPPSLFPPFFKI